MPDTDDDLPDLARCSTCGDMPEYGIGDPMTVVSCVMCGHWLSRRSASEAFAAWNKSQEEPAATAPAPAPSTPEAAP